MKSYFPLFLLLLLGTCVRAQESLLQSGPMLGYVEQREALIWVHQEAPHDFDHDVEIVYDSNYAAAALQGMYKATKELLLIDTGLHVLCVTSAQVAVSWRWVKGHEDCR